MQQTLYDYCKEHGGGELLNQWHPMKNGTLTPGDVPLVATRRARMGTSGERWSTPGQDNTTYYYYDDLKEAVNAAATGSTVKLLGDVDYSSAGTCLDISKELTLDLNGHSIKAQANGSCANDKDTHFISVKNGGKLTVDDTSVGKNGSITAGYKYGSNLHIINVLSGAELTVKAGTIQNAGGAATNYGSSSVYVRGGGVFNLEGGTLHGETAKKRTYPVYNCGTTTISGGTITSNDSYANGITQSDGTLTITNVTVNTTAAAVSVNNKAPAPAISGGTFTKPLKAAWISDGFAAVYDGSVTTVGSSAPADYKACINGKVYYTAAADDAMKDVVSGDTIVLRDMPTASTSTTFSLGNTLTVTPENGETFDSSLITVSTGYKLTTSVSGASTTYTVAVDEKAAKAIIGDTYYLTFASANLGATDGNTIKLLKDDSLSGGWTVTKNITIDLNGHELTSEKKSSQSNHYATIKFSGAGKTLTITDSSAAKTGTILNTADASTTSKYGHALAASAGNVVIEGGTFTSQSMEAIYANGGAITVTGGTFSTNPSSFITAPYGVTGAGPFTVACAHTGTLDAHAAVPADCTDTGTKAYWECTNCHKLFSDAQCETEIAAPEAVPAKGHTFGDWNVTKEPTTTEAGSKMRECSVCHFEETETIPVLGTYAITANVTNGTVTAAPNPAAKGRTVTLTLTPKDGYNDADVQLYYSYNDVVNAELSGLTFTMPDAAVTITGTFKPIEYQITYNLDGGPQPTVSTDKPDEATAGVMSVTGGTFSSEPAYVTSGYHAVEDGSSYTVHQLIKTSHAAKEATCTETGNTAYYTCANCEGVYYADADCTETTTLEAVTIVALGHNFAKDWTTDETYHWYDCSRCDAVSEKAAHTFEKTGIVGSEYEWTCNVCGYSKTGAADAHAIDTTKVTNGTVVADPNPATVGQSVKLTLTPKDGYNDSDVQLYYSYNDVMNAELSGLNFTMPDAAVTITGTFNPIAYKITYNLDGGTNSTANPSTYTVEDAVTLTAPTKSGYTFLGWTYEGQTTPSKDVTIPTGSTGDKTFTANWSYNGGGSSGGGGGSSSGGSSSSSTTEKNPDGSTTTTTTDKTTGTVTEVTKETDGTTTTVETKKDGTVTETVKTPDGTTGTVVTDKNGDVTEAKATVSSTAAKAAEKADEAVTLPVEVPAAKTTEDAPAVQVTVPKSAGSVKVEIPVENVTPGTVAVIVNADGTEKIVSTSVVTENGVALTLDGSATVKVIDNSKTFTDVPETNVFYNEISSLSAREIMVGKTEDTFDLYSSVTLNQIANVAGRITGAVDVSDYAGGIAWGEANGLKTGDTAATRGEVLKALYIAAGSPAVEDTSILNSFNDASSIPADMADIVAWAAQNGILKGTDAGNADLGVNVTRGQACALAGRAMGTLA